MLANTSPRRLHMGTQSLLEISRYGTAEARSSASHVAFTFQLHRIRLGSAATFPPDREVVGAITRVQVAPFRSPRRPALATVFATRQHRA